MNTSRLLSPQEAKDRVQTEINEILQCLENKMDEMFTEIETLEEECLSKQRQKQKKIDKINALIEQTEELADNSLLGVQNRIITELQNELSLASIQESKCGVEFEWGFSSDVISLINSITLKRLDRDTDVDRTPSKVPSHPDGTNKPTSLDRTNYVPKEFVSKADHDVPTSPLASPDGSDTWGRERDRGSDNSNRERYRERTDWARERDRGRANSNRERYRERTDWGRERDRGSANSNRERYRERTDWARERDRGSDNSNRERYRERTDWARERDSGSANSNRERYRERTDWGREKG